MSVAQRAAWALPLQILLWAGFLIVSARACDRHGASARAGPATNLAPVTITFDRNQADPAPDAIQALDPIARRSWSDLDLRVLVVGSANERGLLRDNLDLADRRAHIVAEHLVALGMARTQIIISAREAAVADRIGSRCEVEIVAPVLLRSHISADDLESTDTLLATHAGQRARSFASAIVPVVRATGARIAGYW